MTGTERTHCPWSHPLTDADRARLGLVTGDYLMSLCPDNVKPSDIDGIVHNGLVTPNRIALIEYERNGRAPEPGQQWLYDALTGHWRNGKRTLLIQRFTVPAEDTPQGRAELIRAAQWLGETDTRHWGPAPQQRERFPF